MNIRAGGEKQRLRPVFMRYLDLGVRSKSNAYNRS